MLVNERKLLILDLDETLIFASESSLEREADFKISQYFVYKRPYLKSFLDFCFYHFEVAVWTTSSTLYAAEVVNNIFIQEKPQFVWTRERATQAYDSEMQEHFWVKRINKIRRRGYGLEKVIVIDDSPEKWRDGYGNLVKISAFFGAEDDDELKILQSYLEKLKELPSIRTVDKRNWRNEI